MRPLTYILLFVFLVCILTMCGDPANAVSVKDGRTIELTEADAEICSKEGGCILITQAAYRTYLLEIERLNRAIKEEKSKLCV